MRTIHIYGDNRFEQPTIVREACRGIVSKEDKILPTYEVNTDQWFVPTAENEMKRGAYLREH